MIIRNDDVAFDTELKHFQEFCSVCDDYGFQLLQAITPRGITKPLGPQMSNEEIRAVGKDVVLADKKALLQCLLSRNDLIGIHGLWHTHDVQLKEIEEAQALLVSWGLEPTYYIPPFVGRPKTGERWLDEVPGLIVSAETDWLEGYLKAGVPAGGIAYLHSWRFNEDRYELEDLERCLERIVAAKGRAVQVQGFKEKPQEDFGYDVVIEEGRSALNRQIHDFLVPRIEAPWLDVGCNTGWLLEDVEGGVGVDATLRMVELAQAKGLDAQHGRAESLPFADNTFKTVVLSCILEQCDDPSRALRQAMRVGGTVIGVNPYPDSPWGHDSQSPWVKNVFEPEEFARQWNATIKHFGDTHWYFEIEDGNYPIKIIIAADEAFKEMALFSAGKAREFGYEPLFYDLGGLGFGKPFRPTAEELLNPSKGQYVAKSPYKPRLIRDALENNAGWMAWVDADAFIIRPIDEVLTDDYDVGVTMRKKIERGRTKYPDISGYLQAGVVFFNNTDKARQFVELWEAVTPGLYPQSDQYGLNELVREATDLTEYDKVFTTKDGIRVKVFKCEVYNYYYFDGGVKDEARIVHFRGSKRLYDKYRKQFEVKSLGEDTA